MQCQPVPEDEAFCAGGDVAALLGVRVPAADAAVAAGGEVAGDWLAAPLDRFPLGQMLVMYENSVPAQLTFKWLPCTDTATACSHENGAQRPRMGCQSLLDSNLHAVNPLAFGGATRLSCMLGLFEHRGVWCGEAEACLQEDALLRPGRDSLLRQEAGQAAVEVVVGQVEHLLQCLAGAQVQWRLHSTQKDVISQVDSCSARKMWPMI